MPINILSLIKKTLKIIVFFLPVVFPAVSAYPQKNPAVTIQAEVDKARMSIDEELTYKLTINTSPDAKVKDLTFPGFQGFKVLSQAQSSSVSFMGNAGQAQMLYVFILLPEKTGTLTIEPATLKQGSNILSAQPLSIEVLPGENPPQQGQDDKQPPKALPVPEDLNQPKVTL